MDKFIIHKPVVERNRAIFTYSCNDFKFKEEVIFDFELQNDVALRNLCIASSISYFKLHLAQIVVVDWHLDAQEKEFWQWIFRNGFSELVYKNKLDWSKVDNIVFEFTEETQKDEQVSELEESSVVGIGGGKDSSLSVELLNKINIPVLGYSTEIKTGELIDKNVIALNISFTLVQRKIDEQLKTLKENVYFGHIPISLVYAFTGILIAYQKNKKYVFVGNEASADEGNIIWQDRVVNHQWSKTAEFEIQVQNFAKKFVHKDLIYASILRPFSSLKIVELFVKFCPELFSDFSSCNNNFKIDKEKQKTLWCGECAKCLGTYFLLGQYLDEEKLKNIFDKKITDNILLENLMKGLLGINEEKPYDCVATRAEMCYAMVHLSEEIKKSPLLSTLTDNDWEFIKKNAETGKEFKEKIHDNFLPKEILEKILKMV